MKMSLQRALLIILVVSLGNSEGHSVGESTQKSKPPSCGTSSPGYEYTPSTGSCHKYYRRAEYWTDARAICQQEGADLTVINSDVEAGVLTDLQKIYEFNIDCHGRGPCSGSWVAIGAVNNKSLGKFLTIHNQTLAEAGYAPKWFDESDGIHGYMLTDGNFTDLDGTKWSCPFICEKAAV